MNASNELYTNCIERLNEIIALFSARRARYSVLDISEMLNIPVSVVRNDIVSIHTCRELPLTFCPYNDCDMEEEEEFVVKLSSGESDDIELEMISDNREDLYLALSSLEYKCMSELSQNNEDLSFGIHRNYVTKPLFNQAKSNMQVKASEMQAIIEDEKSIRIRYYTKTNKTISLDILPLHLAHVETEDLFYVITIFNGKISPFRLDKIKGFDILDKNIEKPDLEPLEDLSNIWGMELGERVHVKILVKNEGRVQEKVRKDLLNRINGKWSEKGDDLIYEDDVIGIGSFRNWLNGYGSSVLVLEPESLRNEIIESAKKRLEVYKKVQ